MAVLSHAAAGRRMLPQQGCDSDRVDSGVDLLNISESVLTTEESEGELRFHGYLEHSFSRILRSQLEHSLTPLRFTSRPSAAELLQPLR
jgi:hypothetical protein